MSGITDWLSNNWAPLLAVLAGGAAGMSGGSSPRPVGWQGTVQKRPYTRQALPQAALNAQPGAVGPRRPGEAGRRYFTDGSFGAPQQLAAGGIAGLPRKGYYLGGPTDGMADDVPASIDGQDEAALSHGEFVIPADVVSHLGNGNSEAGAMQLYKMMERIRQARTGNPEQGRRVNPEQFMPQ
jgi:hypothetical protein